MGWLCWDETRGAFVGSRLMVEARAFQAAVDTLVANGEPEHEAILALLEEGAWSFTDPGVTVLPVPQRPEGQPRIRCGPAQSRRSD